MVIYGDSLLCFHNRCGRGLWDGFQNKRIPRMLGLLLLVISIGFLGSPTIIIICEARPVLLDSPETLQTDPNASSPIAPTSMQDDIFGDMDSKENEVNYDFQTFEHKIGSVSPKAGQFEQKTTTIPTILEEKSSASAGDHGMLTTSGSSFLPPGSFVDSGFTFRFPPITAEFQQYSPVSQLYTVRDRSNVGPLSLLDEFRHSFLD